MIEVRSAIRRSFHNQKLSKLADNGLKQAAVLVPLFESGQGWEVLFTKRTDKVDHHKGQISFPGGRRDNQDLDLTHTALRETFEEIGVAQSDVEVLAAMEPTPTISNYIVYPFIGVIPHPYDFRLSEFEVDRLIRLPLKDLLTEACDQYPAAPPAWGLEFNRHSPDLIWGATARMLYLF